METITLPLSGKIVRIPVSGLDWQLYTSSMRCERAAKSLTTALKKALGEVDKALKEGFHPTPDGLERLVHKHLRPVMDKYASFGACDTEPRCVALDTLARAGGDR